MPPKVGAEDTQGPVRPTGTAQHKNLRAADKTDHSKPERASRGLFLSKNFEGGKINE